MAPLSVQPKFLMRDSPAKAHGHIAHAARVFTVFRVASSPEIPVLAQRCYIQSGTIFFSARNSQIQSVK